MRNVTLTVCLLGSCMFCFLLVSRGDSAEGSSVVGAYKPVAPLHGLMYGQQVMFKGIRKAIGDKTTRDRGEVIEHLSQALAELANVNTYHNEKADYRAWAGQLRDTALELAEVAEEKVIDEAKMAKLVGQIKGTCGDCHDAYQ